MKLQTIPNATNPNSNILVMLFSYADVLDMVKGFFIPFIEFIEFDNRPILGTAAGF